MRHTKVSDIIATATAIASGAITTLVAPVLADSRIPIGQAVGGQVVRIDPSTFQKVSPNSVNFSYYLGERRFDSQANCSKFTWTTFSDGVVHFPQSGTTAQMLLDACNYQSRSYRRTGKSAWTIIDPPSNIRLTPNGVIACSVPDRSPIVIYGFTDDGQWAVVKACGGRGYIHRSQIQPNF